MRYELSFVLKLLCENEALKWFAYVLLLDDFYSRIWNYHIQALNQQNFKQFFKGIIHISKVVPCLFTVDLFMVAIVLTILTYPYGNGFDSLMGWILDGLTGVVFTNLQHRFSAFWLRSKCSICSYQLNIWYGPHCGSRILNWFLNRGGALSACTASSTGRPGIAVPPGLAHPSKNT